MQIKQAVLAGFAFASLAAAVSAAPQVRFADSDSNGNNNDGFRMDLDANGTYDYVTFCVETQENISLGRTYEYNVSTIIKNRGNDGPLNFDTSTGHALAFVFYTFHTQGEAGIASLSGIGGFTNEQYRELVQRTIWNKLHGGNTTGTFTQTRINQLFNAASGVWTDLGNVRVMNVWDDADTESGARQDMLIIIPLPSVAGLASLGLMGLVATGRRRMA
jgi:hypothetical protein